MTEPSPATPSATPVVDPEEIDLAGARTLLVHQMNVTLDLRGRMMEAETEIAMLKRELLESTVASLGHQIVRYTSLAISVGTLIWVLMH